MLAEVKAALPEGTPVFITGDFNEPSHLDWTGAAARAKSCPLEVRWPTTGAVEAAGFIDTYRSAHPDPVERPGITWTPTTKPTDPKDRHDRIDFVFAGGAKVAIKGVRVVGEVREFADTVVTPYPSDHRAVIAELQLDSQETSRAKPREFRFSKDSLGKLAPGRPGRAVDQGRRPDALRRLPGDRVRQITTPRNRGRFLVGRR